MKHLKLLLLFTLLSAFAFGQTTPTLPGTGTNTAIQTYINTNGKTYSGSTFKMFRVMAMQSSLDSLIALINSSVVKLTTDQDVNGIKSFLTGISIGGVYNDRPNVGDPAHIFNIVNNAGDNSDYLMQMTAYANSTGQANWHVRKARGTYASPLPILSGDLISSEGHRGFDGTNFAASSAAQLSIAEENFDATHNGTSILFQTTPLGNFGGNRVNALKLQASGDAMFYKSVQSNNTALPNYILNSLGANYGLISNISEGLWSLGYGASATSLGTSVLTWGAPGVKVNVISEYTDNAAAVSAGLTVGTIYRTGDLLKVVH